MSRPVRPSAVAAAAAFACVAGLQPAVTTGWLSAAQAANVFVLTNGAAPIYDEPAKVIQAGLTAPTNKIEIVDLGTLNLAQAKARAAQIKARNPDLVIALGDKAAFLADRELAPAPVVFGMVANWENLGLNGLRATGVAMELEPETLASQVKMLLPNIHKVGVIYTQTSKAYVERVMMKAATLELTFVPVFVTEAAEFRSAVAGQLERVDMFWLVEDPAIVTTENVKLLLEKSRDTNVVTLCSSPRLVAAGLTMAISVDPKVVGGQIADIAQGIIADPAAAHPPVATPDRALISMNRQALDRLKIKLDPGLLAFVTLIDTGLEPRAPAPAPTSAAHR